MKKFLLVPFLLLALLIPTHQVAQARPLTTPYCYGDGLPHNNPPIQPCDGKPYNNCGSLVTEDSKPIGNIGTLYLDMSVYQGCAAWFSYVYISHAGCYTVTYVDTFETHADASASGTSGTVCQGQRLFTTLVGDWQGGGSNGNGCYYAASDVAGGFTSTNTFCF